MTTQEYAWSNWCAWFYDETHKYYETECGEAFGTLEISPTNNNKAKYCRFCGGEISVLDTWEGDRSDA